MNFTDFSLKLKGFPLEDASERLREIQQIPEADYSDYVLKQREAILSFHKQHNSYYRKLLSGNESCWEALPVLTKQHLQTSLKNRLSEGYSLNNVYVNKTSGSTGNPFYFAKDRFCHALTWALIKNRFNWHDLYGEKQARFYGLPKAFKPRFKERLKDVLANRYRFDVFDLSPKALDQWVLKFSKTPYVYLNGYTTVIVAFAKYLIKKNIILKIICPSLKACVVTSEMCHESDKNLMEEAFGIPVVNEYGASELDLIAFQNKENEWILNTETLFVEVLDEENNVLPYGEEGRIVITSLYNKAHPFIRYDLGDTGVIEKIDHKKLILKSLIGRKEDIVKLPSGTTAPGLTFYYVTKSIMEDNGAINEIKVVQTALDTFEIHYTGDATLTKNQAQDINNALETYLEPNLTVIFKQFDVMPRSKSGKLKQFTSLIN